MNTTRNFKSLSFTLLLVFSFLVLGIFFFSGQTPESLAENKKKSFVYFPVVQTNLRQAQVPKLLKGFPLDGAECPNDIEINPYSGIIYIPNEESANVSIIQDMAHAYNVSTGPWPVHVESDPYSELVYITHVLSGIYLFEGGMQTGHIPAYQESYAIVPNAINGYTYITDLYRPITILKGKNRITDLFVPDFNGWKVKWQLAADYDDVTGFTYFASWQQGVMSVVDGTTVVDQFNYIGEGAKDLIIDPHKRLAYVTNYRAGDMDMPKNNISIVNIDTKEIIPLYTGEISAYVDIDELTGFVYVTNPEDNTVTVLHGTKVIATHEVGSEPWEIAVDSRTGYAYVTNANDRSVSILKDGKFITTIVLPQDEGFEPWKVAVDPVGKEVYILSRSSRNRASGNPLTLDHAEYIECKVAWIHVLQYE